MRRFALTGLLFAFLLLLGASTLVCRPSQFFTTAHLV